MSEYLTLVQSMIKIGNISHTVSIYGVWIYDANYLKAITSVK